MKKSASMFIFASDDRPAAVSAFRHFYVQSYGCMRLRFTYYGKLQYYYVSNRIVKTHKPSSQPLYVSTEQQGRRARPTPLSPTLS